jgi:Holliday junction DNA helicase RuvA
MIGYLRGTLIEKNASTAIVSCAGVGYEVTCTLSALQRLPVPGEVAELSIHTHVREDQLCLFGFASSSERDLFRQLIGVSGIGPKTALSLLSTFSPEEAEGYLAEGNDRALSRVPGIGAKTAKRLVLELKDRLRGRPRAVSAASAPQSSLWRDLESGLANLGYRPADIGAVLTQLQKDLPEEQNLAELLKQALRRLSH